VLSLYTGRSIWRSELVLGRRHEGWQSLLGHRSNTGWSPLGDYYDVVLRKLWRQQDNLSSDDSFMYLCGSDDSARAGTSSWVGPTVSSRCSIAIAHPQTLSRQVGMASTYCKDQSICKIGSSGILAIVSFFLWLLTAVLIASMDKEPRQRPDDVPIDRRTVQPKEETTETRTRNADGTTTVVTRKTITNPDGSKEVIETSEVEPTSQ
jgi:hypothetical protein